MTMPSTTTPRNCNTCCRDVGADLPRGLGRLDPSAAARTGLGRGDREPALAEGRVLFQSAAELEVHGEPVGLVLGQRLEQRVEAPLGEQVEDAGVVLGREREEQLLLGGEPVEDRAA